MKNVLAQKQIKDIFGQIFAPPGTPKPISNEPIDALIVILNVGLTLTMVVAGFVTLFNFIHAGYTYIMAGGDAKKINEAQERLKWSAIGLLIVVAAPLAAALVGYVVFRDPTAILKPPIKTIL